MIYEISQAPGFYGIFWKYSMNIGDEKSQNPRSS
jgi:hypothetical protein